MHRHSFHSTKTSFHIPLPVIRALNERRSSRRWLQVSCQQLLSQLCKCFGREMAFSRLGQDPHCQSHRAHHQVSVKLAGTSLEHRRYDHGVPTFVLAMLERAYLSQEPQDGRRAQPSDIWSSQFLASRALDLRTNSATRRRWCMGGGARHLPPSKGCGFYRQNRAVQWSASLG